MARRRQQAVVQLSDQITYVLWVSEWRYTVIVQLSDEMCERETAGCGQRAVVRLSDEITYS
jgi:hypothetical protein